MGFFKKIFSKEKKEKLDSGLEKTREGMWGKITHAVVGKSKVDEEVLDNLEEAFLSSDVGVETTLKIIEQLEERVARDKYVSTSELNNLLCDEISKLVVRAEGEEELDEFQVPRKGDDPYVIMVVGVNGVGKTTTIGKLAYQFKKAGNKVMIGAADTFRAASIPQLEAWCERVGVPIVKQKAGSDPAAV
ncbi:MAG: signal recognition particle receptor subunit alpha, partial [Muribaculaceae bacterium]|nr:signal recognition particle receptor subunit alpha [Muribaculaceae bacterium]